MLVSTCEPMYYVVFIVFYVQAGYNPLMLAVANDIEITDYQDMLHHLIDKTGVNLTAKKVIKFNIVKNMMVYILMHV